MTRGEKRISPLTLLTHLLAKRTRSLRLALEIRLIHGPRRPPSGPLGVVALCSLRDGAEFLQHFLRHHRALGVRHFVFLDNGSKDGTVERLRKENDVTIYLSRLPYAVYKHHFKRFLVRRAGRDRWSLMVDIDECFDFPGSDRLGLGGFCRYLDAHGFNAVVAHMLDRFHSGSIQNPPVAPDGDLARIHCYYDLTGIKEDGHHFAFGPSNVLSNPAIKCLSCGVNHAVFGNNVLLTKHPLIRWSPPMELPKFSHDIAYARIADVSAVLHHFKFTAGFMDVVDRAVREDSYHDGSARYRRISEVVQRMPDLTLHNGTARRFESVNELVEAGFLKTSAAFDRWADTKRKKPHGSGGA